MQANDLKELIAQAVRSEISKLQLTSPVKEEDELMTIQEAAKFLRLSVQTLYGMSDLPSMKKKKRLYYSKHDLIAWLQTGKRKTVVQVNEEVDHFLVRQKKRAK